jgi:hypothetical protein
MERTTRSDRAPAPDVVEPEKNEAHDGAVRFNTRGALPPVQDPIAPQGRTASDRGFDDAPAPLTVQERSGLLAHKFEAMKATPQMEAYLAAVSAHDAAAARYRVSNQGAQESRTDIDAAKRAMEAAQKQELRARTALHAAAEAWQPAQSREPERKNEDPDPSSD